MRDEIITTTAWEGQIRVIAGCTTNLVAELQYRHQTSVLATIALGRAATAAAMIGLMHKDQQGLTVRIQGNGLLGQIVVDANAKGQVRGYVDHPNVKLPRTREGKIDIRTAVGCQGQLRVTKNLGLKKTYQGSVPLLSGEISDDFTYYFKKSEQIPTIVGLGESMGSEDDKILYSGGYILQVLPEVGGQALQSVQNRIEAMLPIPTLLEQAMSPTELIRSLIGDDFTVYEKSTPLFSCSCSRQKFTKALLTLGRQEIEQLLVEDGQAELCCHFCNENYLFNPAELAKMALLADEK